MALSVGTMVWILSRKPAQINKMQRSIFYVKEVKVSPHDPPLFYQVKMKNITSNGVEGGPSVVINPDNQASSVFLHSMNNDNPTKRSILIFETFCDGEKFYLKYFSYTLGEGFLYYDGELSKTGETVVKAGNDVEKAKAILRELLKEKKDVKIDVDKLDLNFSLPE